MQHPSAISEDVYAIGGPDITDPSDCCVYLIDCGALALIDTGVGESVDALVANIEKLGFDTARLKSVIITHAHIDHIGGAAELQRRFGVEVIAHDLDATAIESGRNTAAEFYGVSYKPCRVSRRLKQAEETLECGKHRLRILHIPGHTPGSVAVYLDAGKRVLFGQDIHGPYLAQWGADPAKASGSLDRLMALNADVLCEGHFGVYQPAEQVRRYIEGYRRQLEGWRA